MKRTRFRILYREFLFRVVDRELLSTYAGGDAHQLFTQIAAVLLFVSFAVSFPALDYGAGFPAPMRLFLAWRFEHFLVATTMLTVGLFAILSWGSMFPDHRDVLVLAPLPVRARTILAAKLAAIVTAIGLGVLAIHVVAGLAWPLSLNRTAPPIAMPVLVRSPALSPVHVKDLEAALDRDLAGVREHGWLASGSGGGLAIGISQRGVRRVLTFGAAREDSIFQIGSITKTFTGLALARMIQDQRVRLDTTVRELIPAAELPPASAGRRGISLEDLATHRSGLPTMPPRARADRNSPSAAVGRDELYEYLRRRGDLVPSDAAFVYSNLGFGLLGDVLATTANTDYATLIRQAVTEPLGLRDTAIDLSADQRRRIIQGYDAAGRERGFQEFGVLAGAGAMYSTAPDMLAWLEANLHPTGPLASAVQLTHQPRRRARDQNQIGLAWMIDPATGNVAHDGGTNGYTADAFFNVRDDLAVIVLANRGPGMMAAAPRVADAIRARLSGAPAISLDDLIVPATGGVRSWLRMMFAYWFTMIAASVFTAGLMIGIQGLGTALLPRRYFLRVSPLLQLAAFGGLVGWYLLQPIGFVSNHLIDAQSGGLFSASPSYWFLGLFQSLNGSNALPVLAARAWIGLGLAIAIAGVAYAVSYVRTLRGVAEEPDVTATGAMRATPGIGHGPTRGLLDFSLKTIFRSAQPRVVMAFYWGLGFAFAVAFVKTPKGQQLATASDGGAWDESSVPLLVASILMMGASVLAARSAFAMPRDLAANWVFRMVPLREARRYAVARRHAMLALSVVPVGAMSAIGFFWMWPWLPALTHVIALAIVGLTLVEAVEGGTSRIPFACSYLPGQSQMHIKLVIVILLVVPVVVGAATLERDALQDGWLAALMLLALGAAWIAARCRTIWFSPAGNTPPVFDAEPEDRVVTLELWDSRLTFDTVRSPSPARRA